jgi:hypothetical protein
MPVKITAFLMLTSHGYYSRSRKRIRELKQLQKIRGHGNGAWQENLKNIPLLPIPPLNADNVPACGLLSFTPGHSVLLHCTNLPAYFPVLKLVATLDDTAGVFLVHTPWDGGYNLNFK